MVAQELLTGREIRMWRPELLALRAAPFNTGPDAVFVAYYAAAEMSCFLALGWPPPRNVLDLLLTPLANRSAAEFESQPANSNGLIDALMAGAAART